MGAVYCKAEIGKRLSALRSECSCALSGAFGDRYEAVFSLTTSGLYVAWSSNVFRGCYYHCRCIAECAKPRDKSEMSLWVASWLRPGAIGGGVVLSLKPPSADIVR